MRFISRYLIGLFCCALWSVSVWPMSGVTQLPGQENSQAPKTTNGAYLRSEADVQIPGGVGISMGRSYNSQYHNASPRWSVVDLEMLFNDKTSVLSAFPTKYTGFIGGGWEGQIGGKLVLTHIHETVEEYSEDVQGNPVTETTINRKRLAVIELPGQRFRFTSNNDGNDYDNVISTQKEELEQIEDGSGNLLGFRLTLINGTELEFLDEVSGVQVEMDRYYETTSSYAGYDERRYIKNWQTNYFLTEIRNPLGHWQKITYERPDPDWYSVQLAHEDLGGSDTEALIASSLEKVRELGRLKWLRSAADEEAMLDGVITGITNQLRSIFSGFAFAEAELWMSVAYNPARPIQIEDNFGRKIELSYRDSFASYPSGPGNLDTIKNEPIGASQIAEIRYEGVNDLSGTLGQAISYAYDVDNNLESVTYPSGKEISYAYTNHSQAFDNTWGEIRLYDDKDYGDTFLDVAGDISDLDTVNFGDKTSSIDLPPLSWVEVFRDNGFLGPSYKFYTDQPDLDIYDGFGDDPSSVKVGYYSTNALLLTDITTPEQLNIDITYAYNGFPIEEDRLGAHQFMMTQFKLTGGGIDEGTLSWSYVYDQPDSYDLYITTDDKDDLPFYRVVIQTTPQGTEQVQTFDEHGRLAQETFRDGMTTLNQTDLTYDAMGRVEKRESIREGLPAVVQEITDFDDYGQPKDIRSTGINGTIRQRIRYRYQDHGGFPDKTTVTKKEAQIWTTHWETQRKQQWHYTNDQALKPYKLESWVDNDNGIVWEDSDKATTLYTYDNDWNLIETKLPGYTTSNDLRITHTYQDGIYRNKTRLEDTGLESGATFHKATGLKLSAYDANSGQEFVYNDDGRISEIRYLDSKDGSLLHSESTVYDDINREIQSTNAVGEVSIIRYDGLGRKSETISPFGDSVSFAYGYDGPQNYAKVTQTVTQKGESRSFSTVTDYLGRTIQAESADGNDVTTTYTTENNQLKKISTNAKGQQVTEFYHHTGKLLSVIAPNGSGLGNGTTSYTYNDFGDTISINDPQGQVWNYTYNDRGDLISETTPYGRTLAYTYDDRGNLLTETHDDGNVITYSGYDTQSNLSSMTYKDHTDTAQTISYTYSQTGQLNGTNRNGQGRLTTVERTDGFKEEFSYSELGDVDHTIQTIPGIAPINFGYSYSPLGELTQVTDPKGTTDYSYTEHQLSEIKRNNRVIATYSYNTGDFRNLSSQSINNNQIQTSFTYEDNTNRQTNWVSSFQVTNTQTQVNLVGYTYVYDSIGNTTSAHLTNSQHTDYPISYSYDQRNQLTGVQYGALPEITYSYRADQSRSSYGHLRGTVSYSHDTGGRITGAAINQANVTYAYGPKGNISQKTISHPNYSRTQTFHFNDLNQLEKLEDSETSGQYNTANTYNYSYNLNGKRMVTKKNGQITGVEVWDGDSLIFELDSNLTYTSGYIYSPGGEKVAEEDYTISSPVNPSEPALFFYINDLARTPVQITDELNNVVNEAITGPYGNLTFSRGTISSSTIPNPILVNHIDYNTAQTDPTPFSSNGESRMSYGFSVPAELRDEWDARPLRKEVRDNKRRLTQHSHEDDLGLIYMQARWYDPLTGMFLSEDPAGQNLNPYVYVNNNPVSYVDPDGEFAFLVPMIVAAAQGAAVSAGISAAAQLAINGEINMGSVLKSALTGALSAGLSDVIGHGLNLASDSVTKTALHGLSGGAQSAISGDGFLSGFISGAVGDVSAHLASGVSNGLARAGIAGVSSGVSSLAAGGSFVGGFRTGAFIEIFNHGGGPGVGPIWDLKEYAKGFGKFMGNTGLFFMNPSRRISTLLNSKFAKQQLRHLSEHGPKAIQKAYRSVSKNLSKHLEKLPKMQYKGPVRDQIERMKEEKATLELIMRKHNIPKK